MPLFTASGKWPRRPPEKICTGAGASVDTRATMVVVLDEEEVGVGHLGGGIGRTIQKSTGTKILPNYYGVTPSVTRDSLAP